MLLVKYEYGSLEYLASGCKSGATALKSVLLDLLPECVDSGCFNPKTIPGSSSLSIHAEGRAIDIGCPTPGARAALHVLVDQLVFLYADLGIQEIIFDHHKWGTGVDLVAMPWAGWRYLTEEGDVGTHTDHAHIELTREKAASITEAYVRAILTPKPKEETEMTICVIVPVDPDQTLSPDGTARPNSGGEPPLSLDARFLASVDVHGLIDDMRWVRDRTAARYLAAGAPLVTHTLADLAPTALKGQIPAGDRYHDWSAADFDQVY